MKTQITLVPGFHFDAGVVDTVPAAPTEPQKRKLIDERAEMLGEISCNLEGNSDELRECHALMMKRLASNKAIDAFTEAQRGPMRQKVVDAHESVKA